MPTYISPQGNPEVWATRPTGYFTQKEWEAARPDLYPPALPFTIDIALAQKLAEIMAGYREAFAPIYRGYPEEEQKGWPEQKEEALAVLANPSAPTPVLSELLRQRSRGETMEDFARLVLSKAATWKTVYAYLTGQQQRMYTDVQELAAKKGTTIETLLSYPVMYVLPESM